MLSYMGVLVLSQFYSPSTHFTSFRARSVTLKPHCSWASLLGSLPVLFAHSFTSNWHLLFLNQRKRENCHRNFFMTKSPRKNVPDVGIELGAACMPSGHASDRATAPGSCMGCKTRVSVWCWFWTSFDHLISAYGIMFFQTFQCHCPIMSRTSDSFANSDILVQNWCNNAWFIIWKKVYEPCHEKTCLMPFANNKGADQPAHPHRLISAFDVLCFNSNFQHSS